MSRSFVFLTLCLSLGLAGLAAAQDRARTISVTGEGRVEAVPDQAVVSAGVETYAPTAADALRANSAAMTAVLGVLAAAEIAPGDIQTSQLNLNPVWNTRAAAPESPPEITGYAATNIVAVRVRDLERLGAVLDALAGAGANRLQGIAFELSEPRAHEDAARRRAVADARAKAELYASAADVALGPVISIAETSGRPVPMMMRAEAAAPMPMDVPVAEGQVTIEVRVDMVYGIE